MYRKHAGFTLVEIAIVLVIIGLLLGGILKGQELVRNARVRNLADQISAVKAAFFAFQDRYRALPGDYIAANTNIAVPGGVGANQGNGDSSITGDEELNAWNHLANAGFISCSQCIAKPAAGAVPSAANSMVNAYNGVMLIRTDTDYNDGAGGAGPARTNLKTGSQVPADIMSEVDRKIDDGSPRGGELRFSGWVPAGTAPTAATCAPTNADAWNLVGAGAPNPNCGGASLF